MEERKAKRLGRVEGRLTFAESMSLLLEKLQPEEE